MATITEDYVSYGVAKLLKEKGFDEGCSFVVNTVSKGVMPVSWPTTNSDIEDEKAVLIALPTLQMAMKWLREVHKIIITIDYNDDDDCEENERWGYSVFNPYRKVDHATYVTYEEAAEAAIKYCLEHLI